MLDATIRRFLADRAREDPLPKLRRTLRAVCTREPTLEIADGRVWLAGSDAKVTFSGDLAFLASAASLVEVAGSPWGPRTEREGPPTDRASFVALCHAVLDAAGGAVKLADLTTVLGVRLQVRQRGGDPLDEDLDAHRAGVTDRTEPVSMDAHLLAVEIWDELDESERELVTFLGSGGRTAAQQSDLGLGRSATQSRLDKLTDKLRPVLHELRDADQVVLALVDLHAAWKVSGGRGAKVVRKSAVRGNGAPPRARSPHRP